MHLLMARETQLRELAEASAEVLEGFDELEGEMDQKSRENETAIRAQQSAQHELRLCIVRIP